MQSARKYQKGFTLTELLFMLWFLVVAVVGIGVVGTVIWAIYRLVTFYT